MLKKVLDIRKKKWFKPVVIVAAIALVAGLFLMPRGGDNGMFIEDTAQLRDIKTYHSFTGTIAPVDEMNVYPDVAGPKVKEILVEEGDAVKKGDVIMKLDPSSIEESVKELEATMTSTEESATLSLKEAQKSYSDYKYNLDNDLNSTILSAEQAIDNSYAQLVSAQESYNNEVELNNQGLSGTMLNAIASLDTSYNNVRNNQLSLEQAEGNVSDADGKLSDAKKDYEDAKDDVSDAKDKYKSDKSAANKTALETARSARDAAKKAVESAQDVVDSANNQKDQASLSLENAWTSYNDTLASYEAAKINEQNSLTNLFDQLLQAQQSYLNAVDNYNAAVTSSRQQLEAYALKIEQAKLQGDDSVNEVRLENYQRQLNDCEVKAATSGIITDVPVKVGDATTLSTKLAVITNFDKMKVDIKINEYDTLGVTEGKEVEIDVNALDKKYTGALNHISKTATIENGVSYFEAEVDFDADDDIKSGMSVEIRLAVNDLKQVLTVPSAAVSDNEDGSSYVLVKGDGKNPVKKTVTTGATDGTYVQIVEGLSEGEVILENQNAMYGAYGMGRMGGRR